QAGELTGCSLPPTRCRGEGTMGGTRGKNAPRQLRVKRLDADGLAQHTEGATSAQSWYPGRPHDQSLTGRAAHRVIGRLLADGHRSPAIPERARYASEDPAVDQPHVYGGAARGEIVCAAAVYFRRYALGPRWSFVGPEEPLPCCGPLDL